MCPTESPPMLTETETQSTLPASTVTAATTVNSGLLSTTSDDSTVTQQLMDGGLTSPNSLVNETENLDNNSPILSSTLVPDHDKLSNVVIGVSISVVLASTAAVAALMICIVIWKRRKTMKCTQEASFMDRLDLTNPNYDRE